MYPFFVSRDDGEEKQIAQFFVSLFSGNLFIYDYLLRGKSREPWNFGRCRGWSISREECHFLIEKCPMWSPSGVVGPCLIKTYRNVKICGHLTEIWWMFDGDLMDTWRRIDGYLTNTRSLSCSRKLMFRFRRFKSLIFRQNRIYSKMSKGDICQIWVNIIHIWVNITKFSLNC